MTTLHDLKNEDQYLFAPSQNCRRKALGNTPFGEGEEDSVPPLTNGWSYKVLNISPNEHPVSYIAT